MAVLVDYEAPPGGWNGLFFEDACLEKIFDGRRPIFMRIDNHLLSDGEVAPQLRIGILDLVVIERLRLVLAGSNRRHSDDLHRISLLGEIRKLLECLVRLRASVVGEHYNSCLAIAEFTQVYNFSAHELDVEIMESLSILSLLDRLDSVIVIVVKGVLELKVRLEFAHQHLLLQYFNVSLSVAQLRLRCRHDDRLPFGCGAVPIHGRGCSKCLFRKHAWNCI